MRFSLTLIFLSSILIACGDEGGGSATTTPPPGNTGTFMPVYDIQGNDAASPLVGRVVTVSAIVTGDFQDNDANTSNNLGGFYVQELAPDSDSDTSEGVFVFDGNNPAIDVSVGDRVTVEGTVAENFGETQLQATSVAVTGSGLIEPTDINLPIAELIANADNVLVANLERYEGMLVRFPQMLKFYKVL